MKPKKILTRNFKSFSHGKFKNDLRQVGWTDGLQKEFLHKSKSKQNLQQILQSQK